MPRNVPSGLTLTYRSLCASEVSGEIGRDTGDIGRLLGDMGRELGDIGREPGDIGFL